MVANTNIASAHPQAGVKSPIIVVCLSLVRGVIGVGSASQPARKPAVRAGSRHFSPAFLQTQSVCGPRPGGHRGRRLISLSASSLVYTIQLTARTVLVLVGVVAASGQVALRSVRKESDRGVATSVVRV